MQERIERWFSYWTAKPLSWAIFGIWLALRFTWLVAMWCVCRLHERWAVWWAKGKSDEKPVQAGLTIAVPTKRTTRGEAAARNA